LPVCIFFNIKMISVDALSYHFMSFSLSVTWGMSMVSPGTPSFSTIKTGRHDIDEILLLKVALNIHNSHLFSEESSSNDNEK